MNPAELNAALRNNQQLQIMIRDPEWRAYCCRIKSRCPLIGMLCGAA